MGSEVQELQGPDDATASDPKARARAAKALRRVLKKARKGDGELEDALASLQRLVAWIAAEGTPAGANFRLRLLLGALREDADAAQALGLQVRRVLGGGNAARLFASTGLPSKPGLFAELGKRLSDHFLPSPPLDGDLARVLSTVFPGERRGAALAGVDPAAVAELFELLGRPLGALLAGIPEALVLLAHRTAAHAMGDDFLERAPPIPIARSPFVALAGACDALARAAPAERPEALRALLETIAACRQMTDEVRGHLEEGGVSVDLVFRLQAIDLRLRRIEKLARLHASSAAGAASGTEDALALATSLIRGAWQERSLRSLVRSNVQLLSRKVVR